MNDFKIQVGLLILGVILQAVTIFLTLKVDIIKKKSNLTISNLELALQKISLLSACEFIPSSEGSNESFIEFSKIYLEMTSLIFNHGSKTSIKILAAMNSYTLTNNDCDVKFQSYLPILFCYLKFELTSVKLPVSIFYKVHLNSIYNSNKINEYRVKSNEIIANLNLPCFLKFV